MKACQLYDWPLCVIVLDLDHFEAINDHCTVSTNRLCQLHGQIHQGSGPGDGRNNFFQCKNISRCSPQNQGDHQGVDDSCRLEMEEHYLDAR